MLELSSKIHKAGMWMRFSTTAKCTFPETPSSLKSLSVGKNAPFPAAKWYSEELGQVQCNKHNPQVMAKFPFDPCWWDPQIKHLKSPNCKGLSSWLHHCGLQDRVVEKCCRQKLPGRLGAWAKHGPLLTQPIPLTPCHLAIKLSRSLKEDISSPSSPSMLLD